MTMIPWYLPTWHGDIRLEMVTEERTRLVATQLTPTEKMAMAELRKRALSPGLLRKSWADSKAFPEVENFSFEQTIDLNAPVEQVQAVLARELKPGRNLLAAVKFVDGTIEEVWRDEVKVKNDQAGTPYRDPNQPEETPKALTPAKEEKKKPKAAATVAAPYQGCPAPDFPVADQRANRVLSAFLDPDQLDDWTRLGRFVATGQDTGHRYMLTSRESAEITKYGPWSLHDLDEKRCYCVHDWDVPSAEELLALHMFLAIPGGETYLRDIVDDGSEIRAERFLIQPTSITIMPNLK